MSNVWIRCLCAFVGWDCNVLNECSAASRKTLHRYTGAIFLLMLLWFYIGYYMAVRYFRIENFWSQLAVGAVFSLIIWIIERQIILIVGKNKAITGFRIGLAAIMALLGATIIDQTLFGKDIDAQMAQVIEQRTDEQFEYRKRIIDNELAQNQKELDSLEIRASVLSDEVSKRPMIKSTTYNRSVAGVDSLGNVVMATGYSEQNIPNPKAKDLDRVNARIDNIRNNMLSLNNKHQALRDEIRIETKNNIGLLSELEITFSKKVIFSSLITIVFYFGVFGFFLLIELLVVSGKMFSKTCDYEVLIERQQARKIKQIESILPVADVK